MRQMLLAAGLAFAMACIGAPALAADGPSFEKQKQTTVVDTVQAHESIGADLALVSAKTSIGDLVDRPKLAADKRDGKPEGGRSRGDDRADIRDSRSQPLLL